MGLGDLIWRRTPLQLALERGLQPGGNVSEELGRLGEYTVRSRADAEAICAALDTLHDADTELGGWDAVDEPVSLSLNSEDRVCPAVPVRRKRGIPGRGQIVDRTMAGGSPGDDGDPLDVLEVLAPSRAPAATDAVIRAALNPLDPS